MEAERPETTLSDPAGRRPGSAWSRGAAQRLTGLCGGERRRFPEATKGGKGQSLRRWQSLPQLMQQDLETQFART